MKYTIFISLSIALLSCKNTQATLQNLQVSKLANLQMDTLYIEHTTPVHDTLYIPIPPITTTDTLCQQALTQALAHLATHKTTTHNSYGIYYDKYRQQLVMYQNLQAQANTYRAQAIHQQLSQLSHRIVKQQIPTPYTPRWLQTLALIGAAAIVYILFRIYRLFRR